MSKTEKAITAYGEVEYETVECCSCENEIMKKEAKGIIVYDQIELKRSQNWHGYHEWQIYHGGYTEGWVCPYCEDSPISFPERALREVIFQENMFFFALFLFLFTALGFAVGAGL